MTWSLRASLALAAVALALWPEPARAGGLALPVRGVRALSMGGAFVAGADGGNALWSNPARMQGSAALVELGTVWLQASYTDPQGQRADNRAPPMPNPTLAVVVELFDGFSVGAGMFAPYAAHHGFAPAGPQRYALVSNEGTTVAHLAVGASVRLGRFEIGASFQNVIAHVRQRSVLSGYTGLFGAPTDPELDLLNEIELRDDFTPTGNLGLTYTHGPIRVGAAVQLPFTVSGQASFRVRLPSSVFFDGVSVEGDEVGFEIPFPLQVRGGICWTVSERLRLELAMTFENWSVQQQLAIETGGRLRLRDLPALGDYQVPDVRIDRRMQDTWSGHAGAQVIVAEGLALRSGVFVETSAFSDATVSAAQFDGDKLGLAIGGRAELGDFGLELGIAHVFQATREVEGSELRQINPTNPEQAIVIGNGRYTSGLWVGGLGVEWRFD